MTNRHSCAPIIGDTMKLTVTTFTSLDGVMQGAGSPDEDRSNGFGLGGWMVPFEDEDFGRLMTEIFSRVDEFLLGRTSYDDMYAYWSQVTDSENPAAVALNSLPKHVATTRGGELEWENSHPITGDVAATVGELKSRPGRELQVHGSHGLVQTLLEEGLVDVFNIFTFPVVLGEGKRLFGDGSAPKTMRLVSTETTSKGAIFARYETTGPVVQQSAVVEDGRVVIV
jgi:dihydrofolate reductase